MTDEARLARVERVTKSQPDDPERALWIVQLIAQRISDVDLDSAAGRVLDRIESDPKLRERLRELIRMVLDTAAADVKTEDDGPARLISL